MRELIARIYLPQPPSAMIVHGLTGNSSDPTFTAGCQDHCQGSYLEWQRSRFCGPEIIEERSVQRWSEFSSELMRTL